MVGHFIVTDPKSQILNCREKVNSMVYDKDSSIKSKVWAVWVAPASVSKVIFIARFLQSKKTFWVESPELVVSSSAASSLIGRIQLHRSDVTLSDTKADVSAASNVTHKKHKSHIIVKTHGALMLIAWMTTGSLGMIMARYFKTAAKRPILGKALWFQAHIVFMVLTVAATIVSFVLSFVEHRGWAYDVSTHAILGCLVMILAIIQPFVSILRPSPQSDMRFFFNWFHAVNALLIKVLAVTNLFLGFQFIDYKLGWLVNTMGGFVGWEALAFFCLEINSDLARKEKQKLGDSESPEALVKAEVYLLLIYLCGNMAFLVALLVGIGIS
ncbi:putative ferric-chelate reductase 1 [Dendropsophus ebraccatus]|uniref:putative ferric-chelate reductase 1 n=1 Tax=Dendropsophus ebraccatus TaxID=150705 RepID=UPI003831A4BD